MLLFDQRDHLHTAGDMMGVDGIPRNRGVWQPDDGQYDGQRWVFGACGGAAAYRRDAWQQAGGFDPALFMYMEDVDLAWRLQLLGWQALYVPEARGLPQGERHRRRRAGQLLRRAQHDPGHRRATGRARCCAVIGEPFSARRSAHHRRCLAQLARRGGRARLRGQLAGLIGLPGARRSRKRIQASRQVSVQQVAALLIEPTEKAR